MAGRGYDLKTCWLLSYTLFPMSYCLPQFLWNLYYIFAVLNFYTYILQPQWPSCCSLNTPSMFQSQGLCIYSSFCLECFSPDSTMALVFQFKLHIWSPSSLMIYLLSLLYFLYSVYSYLALEIDMFINWLFHHLPSVMKALWE